MMDDAVEDIDRDEYGQPVKDRYRRLGAHGDQEGMYVRFEPGMGLNVHLGFRLKSLHGADSGTYVDYERCVMGIDGWDRLCAFADEWRAREAERTAALNG